jgi:hypothetical protein
MVTITTHCHQSSTIVRNEPDGQQQPTNTSGGIRWKVVTYEANENGWIITRKSLTNQAKWIDQSPVTTNNNNNQPIQVGVSDGMS